MTSGVSPDSTDGQRGKVTCPKAVSWPVAGSSGCGQGKGRMGHIQERLSSQFSCRPLPALGCRPLILPLLCRKCSSPLSTLYSRVSLVSCSPWACDPIAAGSTALHHLQENQHSLPLPAPSSLLKLTCSVSSGPVPLLFCQGAATVKSEPIPNPCWALLPLAPFCLEKRQKCGQVHGPWSRAACAPNSRASTLAVQAWASSIPSLLLSFLICQLACHLDCQEHQMKR